MSFPNQDYLAMLKAKPPTYPQVPQNPQGAMIYPNPPFMPQYLYNMPQYIMMQQMQQMQSMSQIPSMQSMRLPMHPQQIQMPQIPQIMMPFQMQAPIPSQPKIDQNIPVVVKGTKVKLNLKIIREIPQEEDSILDYDEIKKQSGDRQFINLKRKRRLLDNQEAPLMQTRRRSEQSQYLEIRELLKVDDEDMKIILDAYPDTKILLQELRNGNLKKEIEQLLLK